MEIFLLKTPNNPTNGDVIKAMFPDADFWEEKEDNSPHVMRASFENSQTLECFDLDWWNSPWKKVI